MAISDTDSGSASMAAMKLKSVQIISQSNECLKLQIHAHQFHQKCRLIVNYIACMLQAVLYLSSSGGAGMTTTGRSHPRTV